MRFYPVGATALLVECADLSATLALFERLQDVGRDYLAQHFGIDEMVPAACTILLQLASWRSQAADKQKIIQALQRLSAQEWTATAKSKTAPYPLITIPVIYDGIDLDEVAHRVGLSRADLIACHSATLYAVAFTGFAPGFAYLSGGSHCLTVPRRSTPRTRVPAGSVGLAGAFCGIYPKDSPGGWQIIGHTPIAMWDVTRNPAALLQPGQRVRFELATKKASVSLPIPSSKPQSATKTEELRRARSNSTTIPVLEVLAPGTQTLYQDLGRTQQAAQGVSRSGALDRLALKTANRLVGNRADCVALESVTGGLRLKSTGDIVVAVTGADVDLRVTSADGENGLAPSYCPFALTAGDTLSIGPARAGMRSYVAVRGGLAAPTFLGSAASDVLAKIGAEPLQSGDTIWARPVCGAAIVAHAETSWRHLPSLDQAVMLDIIWGPREAWFTAQARTTLCSQTWQVSTQSNRVGLRLQGEMPLQRAAAFAIEELPSEGCIPGALQVPANGQPVLFLADHPLTGGYPVIACLAPHQLDFVGQVPLGAAVRFRPIACAQQ